MKDNDYIEDLFSKAMDGHQVEVRPELWNAIQAKMGAAGVASTTSTVFAKSLLGKSIIGLSSLAVIGVGSYLFFNDTEKPMPKQPTEIQQVETKIPVDTEITEETTVKSEAVISEEETVVLSPINTERNHAVSATIENPQDQTNAPAPILQQTTTTENSGTNEEIAVVVPNKKEQQPISLPESSLETEQTEEPKQVEIAETPQKGFVKLWNNTNVFTPNGDGINDYFFLETGKLNVFSISILDKDNKVVYRSEDPKFQWDGTNYLTGEKVPDGNYSYIIYAVDWTGEQIKQFNLLYITK